MNNLFTHRYKTIFSEYLRLLGVKFTSDFSDKLFNEHPYRYNLYGLSDLLSFYGIKNTGIRITDKSKLQLLEPPFIAHALDNFILVKKITTNKIDFLLNGKDVIMNTPEFYKMWSGVLLFAEPSA